MDKHIQIGSRRIDYTMRVSQRARVLRLEISCAAGAVVTRPSFVPIETAERFLRRHAVWVLDKLSELAKRPKVMAGLGRSRRDYLRFRELARELVLSKLASFNRAYRLRYRKVSIKNQKSRWGSCSRRGNLNFNYKLIGLPAKLQDYIIAHELCHLAEFNHSPAFWQLLSRTVPDWRQCKKELAHWRG